MGTDNSGDLCPGDCPPSCQTGEVIEIYRNTDDRGCPVVAFTCNNMTASTGSEYSLSYEIKVQGIYPENFDTFKDDLTVAVAEALGVLASAVTLTLQERNGLDRQNEYVVIATIVFSDFDNKEMIRSKM